MRLPNGGIDANLPSGAVVHVRHEISTKGGRLVGEVCLYTPPGTERIHAMSACNTRKDRKILLRIISKIKAELATNEGPTQ